MKAEDLFVFPLQRAVLCVNCENVSNVHSDYCPACGSPSLLNLAVALDRGKDFHMEYAAC